MKFANRLDEFLKDEFIDHWVLLKQQFAILHV